MNSFGTDAFIAEIEAQPSIWDYHSDSYSNRKHKANAWEAVCESFFKNFQEMSTIEKNEITAKVQRKWKSLRDSFTRELSRMKKEKSGSSVSCRKRYVYFNQLSFLTPVAEQRSTVSGLCNDQQDTPEEDDSPPKPKRRRETRDEKPVQVLEAKTPKKSSGDASAHDDEERHFLLSLVSVLKSVPDEFKLDAKCELIQVLKKYRR